jgi:tetratricopeptide (TPR) repeat protein
VPSLDLILQGRAFLAAGEARAALRCGEQALRVKPRDPDALHLLGAAHYLDGDLASAEARLRQAIQADGKVAVFHSTLGNVLQDRGAFAEAISAYRDALRLKPDFAEAHNDLGTAYFAQGKPALAAESYQRATVLKPDHAIAYANLGAVYRKLGLPGEARRALQRELVLRLRAAFRIRRSKLALLQQADEELQLGNPRLAARIARKALDEQPDNARAMALLAMAEQSCGALDEAIALAEKAVGLQPRDAGLLALLGELLLKKERREDAARHLEQSVRINPRSAQALAKLAEALDDADKAERILQRALRLRPRDAQLLFQSGELLFKQGRAREAEQAFRDALKADPAHVHTWIRLADLLRLGGQLDEAKACLDRALAVDERSVAARIALGRVLKEKGNTAAAIEQLEEALRLEPSRSRALQEIGEILRYDNQIEAAERHFREALQSRPGNATLLVSLAMVLGDQMRYEEAFARVEEVLAHHPDSARALATKSGLLDATGREAEAQAMLHSAVKLAPDDVDLGYTQGLLQLRHGNFAAGWNGFELRRRKDNFIGRYRKFPFPEWNGAPLEGKTILVYPEQGLGDEIMYGSCIPELASRAAHVVVECDHKLGELFARSFPRCTVAPRLRTLANDWVTRLDPSPDYQMPVGSLPGHFRRRLEQFPRHSGFLKPDPSKVEEWRERLATLGPGPKIGLSWQGGIGHTGKARRSLSLEQLLPVLTLPGVQFVNLQYTDARAELQNLESNHGLRVHHWQQAIDDYDETAALVCALDSVLTVCTALVHLTGALGRPALVMVPFGSDWRYGARGEAMPWYPSVRLLRQEKIGDWIGVLERVVARLNERR